MARFQDLALRILGATSGEQIIKAAAAASGAITLPAGTTDFSGAGPGVVKQASTGAAFTVAPVAATEVTGLAGLTANALIKGNGAGAAPVASTATVDGSGNLTVTGSVMAPAATITAAAGTGDPFTIVVPNGQYGRIYYNATGGRLWSAGQNSDGTFGIWDHTAGLSRVNVGITGAVTIAGSYIYQFGATGAVNATSGPLIYADSGSTVIKVGAGNGIVSFQNYAGTSNFLYANAANGDLNVEGFATTNGYTCRPGQGGTATGNHFNLFHGTGQQLWIDNVSMGTIAYTCDYRIKENVAPLASTWQRVKALRPISYTRRENAELLSVADPAERWGFLAHELQETLTETAATGEKDAPNLVQSPDLLTLLATTVRALQEAMARIEALEARGASGG